MRCNSFLNVRKKSLMAIIGLVVFISSMGQTWAKQSWVDSVFSTLTLEQKIGQLIIIRVPSSEKNALYPRAMEQIKNGVGGVCFFAGKAEDQLRLTRLFQSTSKIPLLVSIDGEWGLGMRLIDGYSFPHAIMLGAMPDEQLVYEMGSEIASQCKKMGIHINYAPSCDINTNQMNPVIGNRSFGEDKYNVTKKSLAYAKGLEQNGVMAVAKHFPGHGNTDIDSHEDLPSILHSKKQLDSIELYPFKKLISNKIGGVMIGHLYITAYDTVKGLPSSLSYNVVSKLLRDRMRFDGFIFTDGLEMKGITKYYKEGAAELAAIQAGVDILLLPADVEKAISTIAKAAASDSVLVETIDACCKKVLNEKYQLLLKNAFDTNTLSLPTEQDIRRADVLTKQMVEQAVTLVVNENQLIPLKGYQKSSIAWLSVEGKNDSLITKNLRKYAHFDSFHISDLSTKETNDSIIQKLLSYDMMIVGCYGNMINGSKRNYGFKPELIQLLDSLQQIKGNAKLIVAAFGSPYILTSFSKMQHIDGLFMLYQNIPAAQEAFVQALFGGIEMCGKLPVSGGSFLEGSGYTTSKTRLSYAYPEELRMSNRVLRQIDSIALDGIDKKAYPGCQILVAKEGAIVYNKSFGRMTYDSLSPFITDTTYYDIASITKIAATTLALMKLVDEEKIKLNDPMSDYLPYLKKCDKEKITIKEALSHFTGFKSYSPFWRSIIQDQALMDSLFMVNPDDTEIFTLISDSLYVKKDYRMALLDSVVGTPLQKKKTYVYSDFGFILLADLVEQVTGIPFDTYVEQSFYHPLGMRRTLFNPLLKQTSKSSIAPTENDTLFRKSLVQGVVHDQTAALMGGVAGHAGLFSTAEDLAVLLQMLLNEGTYGGKRYLSKQVVKQFNHTYFAKEGNRRALGFDKPLLHGISTHVSPMASKSSFGHTGFTGTMFWVDPDSDLIYIFLSNRVYPHTYPNVLASMNIRTKIQDCIYNSIHRGTVLNKIKR